jgi:hypothetical protein
MTASGLDENAPLRSRCDVSTSLYTRNFHLLSLVRMIQ